MRVMLHIIRLITAILFSAWGTTAMPMAPSASHQIEFFAHQETVKPDHYCIHFAARAPPLAVANVACTGDDVVELGNGMLIYGQETVAALFGFGNDFNATNRVPDFQQGTVNGQYTAINPGPLDDGLAGTFSGGRYTEVILDQDVVLNRAGTGDTPLGQFFTQSAPDSVISTRIDSAVLPEWPGGGTSPLDTAFEVRIPAGTKVYVGEVSSQGGFYVGGTQQIVVPKPWLIDGVEVVGSTPLQ